MMYGFLTLHHQSKDFSWLHLSLPCDTNLLLFFFIFFFLASFKLFTPHPLLSLSFSLALFYSSFLFTANYTKDARADEILAFKVNVKWKHTFFQNRQNQQQQKQEHNTHKTTTATRTKGYNVVYIIKDERVFNHEASHQAKGERERGGCKLKHRINYAIIQ